MLLGVGNSSIYGTLINNSSRTNQLVARTTERLATGLRINRASDDPSGLIAAERLRGDLVEIAAQTRVIGAQRRASHIQQSGRQVATDVLNDLRGKIVEASGNTISSSEREAIQQEIDYALDGLEFLGSATGFGVPAELEALRSGQSANVVDGDTAAAAEILDEQLSTINRARAAAGAYEKYTLDVDQRLAESRAVATAAALSEIADADVARETSNLTKARILNEASLLTLRVANQSQADQMRSLLDFR